MASDSITLERPRRRTAAAPQQAPAAPAPIAAAAPHSGMEALTASVARMTQMMEAIQSPLLAYLEDALGSTHHESPTSVPVEKALEASVIGPLLKDDSITDILINGPYEIYINRNNQLEKTDFVFPDRGSLRALAKGIANAVGRSIDPNRPLVDARLKDGSRVNIIAPPMAVDGYTVSIRKFPKQEITLEKLVEKAEMSEQMAQFLRLCAQCRVSLLISGGTGTGKTTLLNAISRFIPENERIITIEDTAELRLQQPHVVRLETKEPRVIGERKDEVNASDLVRNSLRMRPDRIIVGEVRGAEAYDMIQALNTGHDGSMTTVHANSPRDAFTRIENLMGPRMQNTPAVSVRRQIVSALNLIVQLLYNSDGRRVVSSITEIVGMEKDIPTMQEIFKLNEDHSQPGGVQYTQTWTKIIPHHPRLSEMMRADPQFIMNLNDVPPK